MESIVRNSNTHFLPLVEFHGPKKSAETKEMLVRPVLGLVVRSPSRHRREKGILSFSLQGSCPCVSGHVSLSLVKTDGHRLSVRHGRYLLAI